MTGSYQRVDLFFFCFFLAVLVVCYPVASHMVHSAAALTLCALVVATRSEEQMINVSIDGSRVLQTAAYNFLGVNIDSASLYDDKKPGETRDRLNIADPTLAAIAKVFAEAGSSPDAKTTLRIGGGSAESTGWDDGAGQSIVVDIPYWEQIMAFVEGAGFDLVWDLNAMGQRYRNKDGVNVWNSSNAEALLRYVAARPKQRQTLRAVQLGNEPGHYLSETPGAPSPQQHGADFVRLKQLLATIFNSSENEAATIPKLQGPDVCFGLGFFGPTGADKCANMSYFREVLGAASAPPPTTTTNAMTVTAAAAEAVCVIDEVTVHHYGLKGPNKHNASDTQCDAADFLNPAAWETGIVYMNMNMNISMANSSVVHILTSLHIYSHIYAYPIPSLFYSILCCFILFFSQG